LVVESLLDLDRPSSQSRLMRLLPWYRFQPLDEALRTGRLKDLSDDGVDQLPLSKMRLLVDRAQRDEKLSLGPAAVEVDALRKLYGQQLVLDRVDLAVKVGEVVALLGPSGSGKSTLLRCINHLEDWDAGTIKIGGRRLNVRADGRAPSPRQLAKERADVGVGMVFQQFNLFGHLSAKDNIAGPLRWVHGWPRHKADARAVELLERVGLIHRADALPRHLSGGQQQRVAIARAIAPNPSVLLLDEPTSALDPELVNEVLEVIRRLSVEDGLTMIISTHQLRFAQDVADRAVLLSDGRIVEQGPAQEVLTRPKTAVAQRFLNVMAEKM
jgi:polar amino acid transport system permease protein